jgi:hypothetical protein
MYISDLSDCIDSNCKKMHQSVLFVYAEGFCWILQDHCHTNILV